MKVFNDKHEQISHELRELRKEKEILEMENEKQILKIEIDNLKRSQEILKEK